MEVERDIKEVELGKEVDKEVELGQGGRARHGGRAR